MLILLSNSRPFRNTRRDCSGDHSTRRFQCCFEFLRRIKSNRQRRHSLQSTPSPNATPFPRHPKSRAPIDAIRRKSNDNSSELPKNRRRCVTFTKHSNHLTVHPNCTTIRTNRASIRAIAYSVYNSTNAPSRKLHSSDCKRADRFNGLSVTLHRPG